MTRKDFEEKGLKFKDHLNNYHCIWKYVDYITLLKNKDPLNYTAFQKEIMDKIKANDVSWFPKKRSKQLEEYKEQEKCKHKKQE